ncbi:unnamed protein product [Allacma fusca]|uniref:DUF4789 domain-containing protein n=1 Tax=Allacma fusca TaxID=39272 RepID=A0A8J2JUI2_9HEXA|nr:unnamed protein product [Allacma fusca]
MLAIPSRTEFRDGGDPRMSSRMNFGTGSAIKPRETEDFVFGPSSGSNAGVPNAGSMIFAPSPSRPTCPQGCQKPEHQTCFNSRCYDLLKQGPCSPGEWLVEQNDQGQCVKSNCQYPKLPFNGRCFTEIELKQKLCLPDQSIALSRDGTFDCDCTGRDIYDPRSNRCYEAYKQGPCGRSQQFMLTPDTRSISGWKAACVHNPCYSQTNDDQMICYGPRCPHQGNCVKTGTLCTNSRGENGVWSVNDETKMLTCETEAPERHIGNVPTFSCGKGSKRDRTGKCRKVSSVDFS